MCTAFPGFKPILPATGFEGHTKYTAKEGHWLVIDTNIVLHQASSMLLERTVADQ